MRKINVITIDGPSASGKGALARGIANSFGFNILDSGVLYRLYAYLSNMSYSSDEIATQIQKYVRFKKSEDRLSVIYKKNDITSEIRSEIIAKSASEHSSKKEVREALFNIQRRFYDGKGLVADGRDMGTIIFPEAALKVFLQASPEVRAERRANQLKEKGMSVIMHDLLEQIQQRDEEDINRKISPLKPADDSLVIDTSNLSIKEVEQKVMENYKKL